MKLEIGKVVDIKCVASKAEDAKKTKRFNTSLCTFVLYTNFHFQNWCCTCFFIKINLVCSISNHLQTKSCSCIDVAHCNKEDFYCCFFQYPDKVSKIWFNIFNKFLTLICVTYLPRLFDEPWNIFWFQVENNSTINACNKITLS